MAYTTIKKPSDYFNTKLYTGTGSSTSITGVGFQPDLVYTTSRSNSYNNGMFDSVRGVNKLINTNTGSAEASISNGISSFDSDGFSFSGDAYNTSGYTFVGWNWKANGAGSANTDGDIASTVSANTTSGFSIVQYTGNGTSPSTVGHGLGTTPSMIILKALDSANGWKVYHKSLSTNNILFLHTTDAQTADSNYHHSPNNSTFTITGGSSINVNGNRYIAYCFAEKQGFSKFGSYTGNGNADGTFVYTGFKPAFILSKDADTAGENWFIQDTTRNTSNPVSAYLRPNLSNAEGIFSHYDILSNGFKNLYAGGSLNGSGRNIIYMAFAEEPLVGDNPATAR